MRSARTGVDAPLLGGFKWLPWGPPFAMRLSGWVKRDVGIQALYDVTTVAEQPGEIAAGTLNRHILYTVLYIVIMVWDCN